MSLAMGDDVMVLRGLGDEVVTQKHSVAQSEPVSVGTTCPVGASVDDDLGRRGVVKKQTIIEGALVVAEDVLHSGEMGLTGVVHVQAHLLDRV
jgi:hypothetical protein